jgi:peptide/nickel transport system permease protein
MARYIVVRLGHSLVVLFILSMVTFGLLQAAPGGPSIMMSPDMSPVEAARIRENLGLNAPIHVQYVRWIWTIVRGDFGISFIDSRKVSELIGERLPNSLLLTGVALLEALIVGVTAGAIAALKRGSIYDHGLGLLTAFGIAVPNFWLAILAVLVFAVQLKVLPSSGMQTIGGEGGLGDLLWHLVLPSLVLSTTFMARFARFTRSGLLEVLGRDYVRTARAKGLGERAVLWRHAFRNALIPLVTVVGFALPVLVGGTAITEAIFGWPGMGRLAVTAAFQRDYPVVMGVTMAVGVVVVISNLLVDLLYLYLDPRVKLS